MKKEKEKKFPGLTRVFLVVILFLALVQVFISYRLATAGKLVGELEAKSEKLKAESIKIEEVINQKGSLSVVYQKAQSLGFEPVEEIFYLTSEIPVALGR